MDSASVRLTATRKGRTYEKTGLGFSTDEAERLLVRADLLIQLQKLIASDPLTIFIAFRGPKAPDLTVPKKTRR